jgi:PHD/YefM family antitoxin component YafN of YafNO toxin-antitoxin module
MNIYYKKVRLKEMAMEMIEQKLFTEARKELSDVFDTVVIKQRPVVINRRKDAVALIEREQLKELLSRYTAAAEELPEKDGSMTIAIDELDIAVNGLNKEAAVKDLIEELRTYATNYLERITLFLESPNRRSHYPFILRILLADNDDELMQLVRWS